MGKSKKGGGSSKKALAYQIAFTEAAQKEQREQFNFIKSLIEPFSGAGTKALGAQMDLLGLGTGSQEQAISALTGQPYFKELIDQGEQALLQNAAATGGLRGGNTQAALAQFRPSMIQQLVQQQMANLGGVSGMGLNAAGTLSNAASNYADDQTGLLMSMGNAYANRELMKRSERGGGFGGLLGAGLQIAGAAGGLGWQPFAAKAAPQVIGRGFA